MNQIKAICAALLLACASLCHAAGFQITSVPQGDGKSIDVGIWYPSDVAPTVFDLGPYRQTVAIKGALAGEHLPLIVMSHGTGGSFIGHHDTAIALADAGFIVVSLTHPGDNYKDQSGAIRVLDRPVHVSKVLDYVLNSWSEHKRIDANRIGVFGFSAGAFTALVLSGGVPELAKVAEYCPDHRNDFVCLVSAPNKEEAKKQLDVSTVGLQDKRIKAAVVAAPALGFTFAPDGLKNVSIPIQLWRAENDRVLPHPAYAEAVRGALPSKPEYHVVANAGHFDFLTPCTDALAKIAPDICRQAEGFDRVEFHREFNAAVVDFFKRTLSLNDKAAAAN